MLSVRDLSIEFHDQVEHEEVVHGISFDMGAGEILGLVGESGSGKTVTALAIAGLLRRRDTVASGQILLDGRDLLPMPRHQLRGIQGKHIGMVFQEPMTSLNPLMKVGHQVEEAMRIHTDKSREELRAVALDVMAAVELPEPEVLYNKYPHQLSGGQRQRVMIAAAIILNPKLLICDEPTTALDVTIQAQILELLGKVNRDLGVGILFISHDLHVVRRLCHRAIVMQNGHIVEQGDVDELFEHPQEAYTQKLIASIPGRRRRRG